MLRRTASHFQISIDALRGKLQTKSRPKETSAARTSRPKNATDDKFGQALLEYVAQSTTVPSDPKKKIQDVKHEREVAGALERYLEVQDTKFNQRIEVMLHRATEALDDLPKEFLDEACALETSCHALRYLRPADSPPIDDYSPGYGLDVPQLRAQTAEYPIRYFQQAATDDSSLSQAHPHEKLAGEVEAVTQNMLDKWSDMTGTVRKEYPWTGMDGVQFELYIALNKRALKRQLLLLELASNDQLKLFFEEACQEDIDSELKRRGVTAVDFTEIHPRTTAPHYDTALEPKYNPF